MSLTPTIAIHMSLALTATALGPVALWARMGSTLRPQLHRATGYAWVTCMAGAALSGLFSLYRAFRYLAQGNIAGHRKTMQWLYVSACLVTGAFTLLPNRYLGQLVWGQWLGLL